MIEIRKVKKDEIYDTAVICFECWKDDYKHFVPMKVIDSFNIENNAEEIKKWLSEKSIEVRLLYGALYNNTMVGFITVRENSEEPLEYEIEIDQLFVKKEYRGKGISLKLLYTVVEELKLKNLSKVLLYNFKDSYSNEYYKKLNGEVVREITQNCGGKELKIDIFGWDLNALGSVLKKKIQKYL